MCITQCFVFSRSRLITWCHVRASLTLCLLIYGIFSYYYYTFLLFLVMGKDWLVLDVISDDRGRAFKYFVADFVNFCTMEDLVNPVDRQKINYLSSSYLQ